MHYNVSVQSENCFAAEVGTSTPPMVHGSRPQLRASNMTRRRAPSTKNVYMTWNTSNKRKKRLVSVNVPLLSSFFSRARITHFSRRCLDRSSTLPSFMKARSSKKRWWQFLSTRFKSRLCPSSRQVAYHERFPKKKKARCKCSKWCFGTNNPTGAINVKRRLYTSIKRCTAWIVRATGLSWQMSDWPSSQTLNSSEQRGRRLIWSSPKLSMTLKVVTENKLEMKRQVGNE